MGTALLSIGVRAMAASYAAMQTTSHNIANASVEGYSRQQTMLATSQGQYTGVGFFGRGVDVVGVVRTQDAFLAREASTAKALASLDAARRDQLAQLELVFKSGEQGIGHAMSQFFASMSDLASRPADAASREVVLARAQDVALRFSEAGEQLSGIQRSVNQELRSSVEAVNTIAASIAKVNNDIAAARGLGQQPNDLLDQRDRLVSQLSEYVQVSTLAADDGTLGVFMGGGQRLVLGNRAEELKVISDPFDGTRSAIALSEGGSARPLEASALGGGRIPGLMNFQNDDLVAAQTQLGQMARALARAVNDQQLLGRNLQPADPNTGTPAPSQPMFAFLDATAPRVQAASTNDRDALGNFTSQVSIVIADETQLDAAEYELREASGNPGQWVLSRIPNDGSPDIPVNSGDTVKGMTISFDAGPNPGERFLLQPVTLAANGLYRNLNHPLDIAAASPLVSDTVTDVAGLPIANTGTASVSALRMTSTPVDVQGSAQITFGALSLTTPGARDYTWDLYDANGAVIGSGSGTWQPGKPFPSPPDADINGFQMELSGVPAQNDIIVVRPNQFPENNNGNALSLSRLNDLSLVGRAFDSNGAATGGVSFNEAFVAALADIGVRSQGATAAAAISESRASQAEASRTEKSGVNLDEEAARLIQYQQSYQAAAKVLQIAQQVFSNLLDIAG